MLLVIIAIIIAYKRAKDYGRNPLLWAAIAGGTYIGTQLAVGLGIGVLAIILGWEESFFEDNAILITVISIIASIATTLFAISRIKPVEESEEDVPLPPPPPTFNQ